MDLAKAMAPTVAERLVKELNRFEQVLADPEGVVLQQIERGAQICSSKVSDLLHSESEAAAAKVTDHHRKLLEALVRETNLTVGRHDDSIEQRLKELLETTVGERDRRGAQAQTRMMLEQGVPVVADAVREEVARLCADSLRSLHQASDEGKLGVVSSVRGLADDVVAAATESVRAEVRNGLQRLETKNANVVNVLNGAASDTESRHGKLVEELQGRVREEIRCGLERLTKCNDKALIDAALAAETRHGEFVGALSSGVRDEIRSGSERIQAHIAEAAVKRHGELVNALGNGVREEVRCSLERIEARNTAAAEKHHEKLIEALGSGVREEIQSSLKQMEARSAADAGARHAALVEALGSDVREVIRSSLDGLEDRTASALQGAAADAETRHGKLVDTLASDMRGEIGDAMKQAGTDAEARHANLVTTLGSEIRDEMKVSWEKLEACNADALKAFKEFERRDGAILEQVQAAVEALDTRTRAVVDSGERCSASVEQGLAQLATRMAASQAEGAQKEAGRTESEHLELKNRLDTIASGIEQHMEMLDSEVLGSLGKLNATLSAQKADFESHMSSLAQQLDVNGLKVQMKEMSDSVERVGSVMGESNKNAATYQGQFSSTITHVRASLEEIKTLQAQVETNLRSALDESKAAQAEQMTGAMTPVLSAVREVGKSFDAIKEGQGQGESNAAKGLNADCMSPVVETLNEVREQGKVYKDQITTALALNASDLGDQMTQILAGFDKVDEWHQATTMTISTAVKNSQVDLAPLNEELSSTRVHLQGLHEWLQKMFDAVGTMRDDMRGVLKWVQQVHDLLRKDPTLEEGSKAE
jgi:hypothetical protein